MSLLRQVVQLPLEQPLVFAEKGIHLPRAVILHGPPGTGKSLLGQAVSGEVKAATFHMDASVAFGGCVCGEWCCKGVVCVVRMVL